MLRGACLLGAGQGGGGREEVVAALDRQLALTVACCAPEMHPEDRARVEQAATM
jgi:hypothetical protein